MTPRRQSTKRKGAEGMVKVEEHDKWGDSSERREDRGEERKEEREMRPRLTGLKWR